MTIESQKVLDARHAELTDLAKRNNCWCGGELFVAWGKEQWFLWCPKCKKQRLSYLRIKPKPTRIEETASRIKKMEESVKQSAKQPKYNIDELFGGTK